MITLNTDSLFKDSYSLNQFSKLKIYGDDIVSFLQGQLTNDINNINSKWAHLASRLDRTGRIQFAFYLLKDEQSYVVLSLADQIKSLKEDLEKYVISEDVNFEITSLEGCSLEKYEVMNSKKNEVVLSLGGQLFSLSSKNDDTHEIDFHQLQFFFEQPELINTKKVLINDSPISTVGLSLNKGCFLGQETASKLLIRGKSTYVSRLIIEADSKSELEKLSHLIGNRKMEELSFQNKIYAKLKFKNEDEKTTFINVIKNENIKYYEIKISHLDIEFQKQEIVNQLFENAIDLFHKNQLIASVEMVQKCIELNSLKLEAYELLAQAQSAMGKNEDAINTMNVLLEVDPNSFMAHTNLSIFYLKLNNIEKAEEHKAFAASKQMSMGSVNQNELDQRKRADQDRRMAMFSEVLEIDPEDEMALSGLANIYLERELYKKSLNYFEALIKMRPTNLDYLFKTGLNYLKAGMKEDATLSLTKALVMAKEKNDLTKCALIENYLKSIL